MSQQNGYQHLAQSWQDRFAFYDEYGVPGSSSEARAAFKALPLGTKLRLNANFWAFLFGPIYFFVKGMWRKGLVLVAVAVALAVVIVATGATGFVERIATLVVPALAMTTANYAYYLHVVKSSESWNLFEGSGRR